MEKIIGQEFGGERPLYRKKDLYLEDVTIHAGESALKETGNITAVHCRFEGKYPFWECDGFVIRDCLFTVGARSALWYSRGCEMYDSLIDAPKMFRRTKGIKLRNVQIGYNMPKSVTDKLKMERIRFYLSAQNLITIKSSKFTGADPEAFIGAGYSKSGFGYPIPLNLTFGVNVGF